MTDPTASPAAEDLAYWCETVGESADSNAAHAAVNWTTGTEKPGHALRVAAELWLSNPDPLSMKDLEPVEYVNLVLAVPQVHGSLPDGVHRAAAYLRECLLSRWPSKAEAATELLDNCLGEAYLVNACIADRHHLTHDDVEQIERDASADRGVSIAETGDGWYVLVDCTV